MSTNGEVDVTPGDTSSDDFDLSELSEAGRLIDAHRTRRRLTKGALARMVGISRQQLWRVMTGKSALTPSLRERLAAVLGAADLRAAADLRGPTAMPLQSTSEQLASAERARGERDSGVCSELVTYLRDPDAIARTLATLPGGSEGRWLYRAVFDVIEEMAAISGIELTPDTLRLRRGSLGEHATSDALSLSNRRESPRSA